MKKILVAIMAVLFAAPSFAQYSSGGFSLSESTVYYGVRLGVNFSGISGDYYGSDVLDMGTKVGMNLGAVVGLRLSDVTPIFLESGLYYSERGAKKDKNKIGLTYLEVPVLIKYGTQINNDIALLPYIGPYFSYGFAGNFKVKDKDLDISRGSYHYFNHGDMGFKIGCGAEYNKLYLELGYQFGVANIAKDKDKYDDTEANNHALYLNVGVNF